MARTGAELKGFLAAAELLLNEDAYLAWTDTRGQVEVPVELRRQLADFLTVVGGDGQFHGTQDAMRRMLGETGRGWVAPSTNDPDRAGEERVWHAVEVLGQLIRPRCGQGEIDWPRAQQVGTVSGKRWCTQRACQKRLAE